MKNLLSVLACGAGVLAVAGCRLGHSETPPSGGTPGAVSGTVLENVNGRSVSGAYVSLAGRDTSGVTTDGQSTTTRSDGTFLFARVSPGDYVLTASSPGYRSDTHNVRVYPGTSRSYQLTLRQGATCPTTIPGKASPPCRGAISATDRTSQRSP